MTKFFILLLSIGLIISGFFYGPKLSKLHRLSNLYDEKTIAYNFSNIDEVFEVSEPISASDSPHKFKKRDYTLPKTLFFEGEDRSFAEGLDHFKTDGMIVLHEGNLLYENYWNNNSADTKHIAFSVSKSFLSALVGIALEDGLIDSIADPITKYLPDFNGTGYEGVSIKNILQMSSGVEFNDD